jgi:hypothetical protein
MYPYVLLEGLCNVSSVGRFQMGCVMLLYVEVSSADRFILGAQFSPDLLGFLIFRFVLFRAAFFFVRNLYFNISEDIFYVLSFFEYIRKNDSFLFEFVL